jgi:hypothetical protein
MSDTNDRLLRARSIPSYGLTFKFFHLLGAKVRLKPDSPTSRLLWTGEIPESFHGAEGTIVEYSIRPAGCYGQSGGVSTTSQVVESWTIAFDKMDGLQVVVKSRDQFEVIGGLSTEGDQNDQINS